MLGYEWLPVAGALVGLVVGLTGVGGGALMAPILLVGFGLDLATVVATDLLFATITKLAVTRVHHKNQFIDWQVTKRLWLGSIPATFFIVWLAQTGQLFASPDWVVQLLGALVLLSAISLLFGDRIQALQSARRTEDPDQFLKIQPVLTTLAGGILGTLVTLTSVGAGALGAVFLRALYPLRMQAKRLVATDTIHAIPVSLFGGLSYLALGLTNLNVLTLLLLGSVPAAIFGAKLVAIAPVHVTRTALGFVLCLAGLKLLTS
jgi:uncharacterized protein